MRASLILLALNNITYSKSNTLFTMLMGKFLQPMGKQVDDCMIQIQKHGELPPRENAEVELTFTSKILVSTYFYGR